MSGPERSPRPCRCGAHPTRCPIGGWTCGGCRMWYPAESEWLGGRGLRCRACDKRARALHGSGQRCWACVLRAKRTLREAGLRLQLDAESKLQREPARVLAWEEGRSAGGLEPGPRENSRGPQGDLRLQLDEDQAVDETGREQLRAWAIRAGLTIPQGWQA